MAEPVSKLSLIINFRRSWWFICIIVVASIDFQNVTASWLFLFIAIKRQWCLECILKFEGFAKTKGFLLRSDLLEFNLLHINKLYIKWKCIEVYEGFRTSVLQSFYLQSNSRSFRRSELYSICSLAIPLDW